MNALTLDSRYNNMIMNKYNAAAALQMTMLYVPHVQDDTCAIDLINAFELNGIAKVKEVTILPYADVECNGKSAILEVEYWFDNITAINFANSIKHRGGVKLVYNDPCYCFVEESIVAVEDEDAVGANPYDVLFAEIDSVGVEEEDDDATISWCDEDSVEEEEDYEFDDSDSDLDDLSDDEEEDSEGADSDWEDAVGTVGTVGAKTASATASNATTEIDDDVWSDTDDDASDDTTELYSEVRSVDFNDVVTYEYEDPLVTIIDNGEGNYGIEVNFRRADVNLAAVEFQGDTEERETIDLTNETDNEDDAFDQYPDAIDWAHYARQSIRNWI